MLRDISRQWVEHDAEVVSLEESPFSGTIDRGGIVVTMDGRTATSVRSTSADLVSSVQGGRSPWSGSSKTAACT